METEHLKAMLAGSCKSLFGAYNSAFQLYLVDLTGKSLQDYDLAMDVYCKQAKKPLPQAAFQAAFQTALDTALVPCDGASYGNRYRAGVRKASKM